LLIWVVIAGIVMGGATLLLIAWAHDHYDSTQLARTMGLTAFAFGNLFFSFCCRDDEHSVFSLGVLEDRMFLLCSGGSLLAILLGTEVGFLQRILHTEHLDVRQWLVCIAVGFAIVPVSEGRRLLLARRRRQSTAESASAIT
jgi:magnesium-transporting ATPase (P-type)